MLREGKEVLFVSGRRFSMEGTIFGDIEYKVLHKLPCYPQYAERMHVIASGGAHMLEYTEGAWHDVYRKHMTDESIAMLIDVYEKSLLAVLAPDDPALHHKSRHVNKDNMMLSCTSIEPTEEGADLSRHGWDDNKQKRRAILKEMYKTVSQDEFDIHVGGGTTLDISPKGVNKRSALEQFFVHTGFKKEDAVFVGDGFGEGGNDEVVRDSGVAIQEVTGPKDVLQLFAYEN
jgi:hydroxymethylpyrimidine pyrophosphatase-like HAD family hydrolase